MTACITRAVARGVRMVACASTGNTSSSMAAYAARAGLKALLFVPYKQISAAKLAQALDFGALVVEVGDTFDQAFGLLREIAPELGLYLVNSINPFRIEGQKTIVAAVCALRWSRQAKAPLTAGQALDSVPTYIRDTGQERHHNVQLLPRHRNARFGRQDSLRTAGRTGSLLSIWAVSWP